MKKLIIKTSWPKAGMIVSACLVLLGILTLCGVLGGVPANDDAFFSSSSSGYTTFGADFYTYINNNAASAALYAIRTTALLRNVSGFMFIGIGIISFCFFAEKRSSELLRASQDEKTPNKIDNIKNTQEISANNEENTSIS